MRRDGQRTGRQLQHPDDQRHRPDRGDGGRVRLEVRRRHLGARPRPSSRRRRAAGRSRCSSTGSRSTWRPATGPAPRAKIKLGAKKDGKLVAMIAETHGTGGSRGGSKFPLALRLRGPRLARGPMPRCSSTPAAPAPCGAPGHPQGCAVMEAAMDDLADKLGIDPLEFRLKNLPAGRLSHADLRGRDQAWAPS